MFCQSETRGFCEDNGRMGIEMPQSSRSGMEMGGADKVAGDLARRRRRYILVGISGYRASGYQPA